MAVVGNRRIRQAVNREIRHRPELRNRGRAVRIALRRRARAAAIDVLELAMRGVAELYERIRAGGSERDALQLVVAVVRVVDGSRRVGHGQKPLGTAVKLVVGKRNGGWRVLPTEGQRVADDVADLGQIADRVEEILRAISVDHAPEDVAILVGERVEDVRDTGRAIFRRAGNEREVDDVEVTVLKVDGVVAIRSDVLVVRKRENAEDTDVVVVVPAVSESPAKIHAAAICPLELVMWAETGERRVDALLEEFAVAEDWISTRRM